VTKSHIANTTTIKAAISKVHDDKSKLKWSVNNLLMGICTNWATINPKIPPNHELIRGRAT